MFGSGSVATSSSFKFPATNNNNVQQPSFGSSQTPSLGSGSFSLGAPAQPLQRTLSSSSIPMFGGNTPSANNPSSLLGGGANKPLFGGSTAGSGGGVFGNAGTASTQSGGFGSTISGGLSNTQSGGLFGSGGNTSSNTSNGGLFGNNASKPSTGGLFGNNTSNPSTGGLFGSNTSNPSTGGLFGSTSNPPTGGLFGSNTSNSSTGGLFGSNTSNPSTGGLFNTNTSSPSTGGLFGATKPGTTSNNLFGSTSQPANSNSLFGSNTTSNNPSLFGSSTTTNAPTGSLFGSTALPTTPSTNSMFNSSLNASRPSLIASIDQASFSLAGTPTANSPSLGPLTTPRRNNDSATGTPGSLHNSISRRQSSLKASSSARLSLSSAKSSPYLNTNSPYGSTRRGDLGSRSNLGMLSRSRSELNLGPGSHRPQFSLRSERSIDDFSSIPNGLKDPRASEIKKLVINKRNVSLESITGRPSRNRNVSVDELPQNGNKSEKENNRPTSSEPFLTPSFNRTQREQKGVRKVTVKSDISQTATEAGYWISPSLSTLQSLSRQELQSVDNLTIGRHGFGQLAYCQPVDLTDIDLSDILGNLVIFGPVSVCVYADESKKAPVGQKLNVPAIVALEKTFAVDKKTNQYIRDPVDPRLMKHKLRLRRTIESRGGEFLSYDVDNGFWVFKVPHFSVWGLPDDDDYDDDEFIDEYPQESELTSENFQNGGNAAILGDDRMQELGLNDDFSPNNVNISEPIEDVFVSKSDNIWGISNDNNNFKYGSSDEEEIQGVIDSEVGTRNSASNNVGFENQNDASTQPSQQLTSYTDIPSIDMQDDAPQPRSWIEQLNVSSRLDSPLAFLSVPNVIPSFRSADSDDRRLKDTFTTSDLDQLLFGGVTALSNSSTSQYDKAAKELRLPAMFSKTSFARFSPGWSEKLLVKGNEGMVLKDIPEQNSTSPSIISSLINRQIQMSSIQQRSSNGLPLTSPNKELTMKFLSSNSNPSSTEEKELWELASILFDDVTSTGLEPFDQDSHLSPHIQERIKEQHRRTLLSNWLKRTVSRDVLNDATNNTSSNPLDLVLIKLSGNLLQDAAITAVKSNNLHLATLIPLLGTDDRTVREDARNQVEDWEHNKTIFHIPPQVRKVFELLSGNTTLKSEVRIAGEVAPALYLSEGLDWLRAFGLKLWYESNRRISISEVVESYRQAFENPSNKVARPTVRNSDKFDIKYRLLRLYGSMNPSLSSVLETINGIFNFREAWYIYVVLVLSSGLFSDIGFKLGDQLSVDFGCQLENLGLWVEAIFVFTHIRNDVTAKLHIERVLSYHVDDIDHDQNICNRLINDFKIPESYIYSSRALKARYRQDHLEESINLIKAQLWEEAHKTIISKVAPRAVIENRPRTITDLLTHIIHPDAIYSWDIGGQMYLDYADLIDAVRPGISKHDEQTISRLANRLSKSLGNVKIGNNPDIKVAVSLMSAFVGKYAAKVSKTRLYRTCTSEANNFRLSMVPLFLVCKWTEQLITTRHCHYQLIILEKSC